MYKISLTALNELKLNSRHIGESLRKFYEFLEKYSDVINTKDYRDIRLVLAKAQEKNALGYSLLIKAEQCREKEKK